MFDKRFAIDAAGLSHQGRVREQNEDRFVIDQSIGCYMIADGMGGHQAGEVASRIATDVISTKIAHLRNVTRVDPTQLLREVIISAHQAVTRESLKTISKQGMGSTVVILWSPGVSPDMWLGHVGDSRAYMLRGSELIRLTEDHTVFNQAKKAGLLGDDPSTYPPRSVLSQALGASAVISPDITRIGLQDNDTLLLCSDGLTDMLSEDQINSQLGSGIPPVEQCQALVQGALDSGGKDNVSVVVLKIHAIEERTK